MNASIVLDQAGNSSFTNLDEISGRVILRLAKAANLEHINVKLEGESRTRLLSPSGPNGERPRPQLEYHKVSASHEISMSRYRMRAEVDTACSTVHCLLRDIL